MTALGKRPAGIADLGGKLTRTTGGAGISTRHSPVAETPRRLVTASFCGADAWRPSASAPALGAVGFLLVLSFGGGCSSPLGSAALLAFVALRSVAVVSSSVVEDRQVE